MEDVMRSITKQQISAIHALLSKHNLLEEKRQIIAQISNGRTESTTALTWTEAQQWINAMNKGKEYKPNPIAEKDKQKMINAMIATAHEMGWIKKKTVAQPDGSLVQKNDYTDLHAWVEKYGYLKKPLKQYTYEELPTLVTAFRKVYFAWLKNR